MTSPTPSKENCTACQAGGASDNTQAAPEQNQGVTYDEGNGIKRNVVMSGPLSQIVAAQMNAVFKKQEFELNAGAPEPALETHAQDIAVRDAFHAAANQPDNQVILANFDVASIKEHLTRMQTNKPNNADLEHVTPIEVVAATADQLLDPCLMDEYAPNRYDEILVVDAPVVGATDGDSVTKIMIRDPGSMITKTLRGNDAPPQPKVSNDEPTLSEKVKAIERLYPNSRLHLGVESFLKSLRERATAKPA